MKFYAEPHLAVFEIQKKRILGESSELKRAIVCQFDNNGEFETDNESLITKLSKKFKHDEPIVTIDEKPVEAEEVEISAETKLRHCKKCDFTCDTQGQLLKHYREEHSKGGD